jgi:hypothetical protein
MYNVQVDKTTWLLKHGFYLKLYSKLKKTMLDVRGKKTMFRGYPLFIHKWSIKLMLQNFILLG